MRACLYFFEIVYGQMAEWLKATDCKSVLFGVRRFETYSAHSSLILKIESCDLNIEH